MTRKTLELFEMDDSRGVSPVIGVILMVAITVILAAVIGTFVLGLGENVSTSTPQAQLTLSGDAENITIAHKGGDPIAAGDIEIKVSNSSDGTIATYSPNNDAPQELTVGDTGILEANNSSEGVLHWPNYVETGNSTAWTINDGTPYNIQIVHKPSDQLIMDRTVRP